MNDPQSTPEPRHPSKGYAGGFFIFLGLLAGAILGVAYGHASLGMVLGFAVGSAIATAIWLLDRRRG